MTVTVTSSANPSSLGQDVIYTATLVTSDSGSLDLGDTVEFQDNGSDITGCNSQPPTVTGTMGTYTATCDEPAAELSVGTRTIAALFAGDTTYAPGSDSLTQTVNQGATTTAITSPSPGSSVTYGNESQNSFNAMVSAPAGVSLSPSGNVGIFDGTPGPGTYLCTAYLNGTGGGQSNGNCYLNNAQLDAGLYSLTAVYGGDNDFTGSSSTPQSFTVDQVTTQMQVFPVPGYAFYGAENGNFFIVGAGGGGNGNPTGFFSITTDGVSLAAPGSCSAGNGGANPCFIDSATALPASTTPYIVTVAYPGDTNFTAASATVSLSVFPATSSTRLTVSPSPVTYGEESSVSISATVTSGTTGSPSGSVAVQSGGSTVCTITNLTAVGPNAATGSCPTLSASELPPGSYSLTANYLGDGNFQSSSSSARPLTISNQGYWEVASDGGIFSFGTAQFFGSTGGSSLSAPIVGMASTPDGGGYWLVALDGGVFTFGDAHFYGSMGGMPLNQPIVGMASTPDGGGYWLVAQDGGVFTFGDAHFYGSMGGMPLNQPIVGMAVDPATGGYWEVAGDGGIFAFNAPFRGSTGNLHLNATIVGMASTKDGGGYWEVGSDGGLFAEGDALFFGSMGGQQLNKAIVAMATTPDGAGYRLVASDGGIFTFGDAEFDGSMGGQALSAPVVGIASSE